MKLKLGASRGVCDANNFHWINVQCPVPFGLCSARRASAWRLQSNRWLFRAGRDGGAQGPAPPNWPKLPDGAACTNELTHYQTVLDADVGTGNVNRSVYDEIETELVRRGMRARLARTAKRVP